ncbi:hypothetical protein SRU_1165 [Salinibacter ruber DSM 13855]|uniref:Uncharacterized protein n=1 Tax=Salinibacter ruber (strain DSM 13855 / M31) TaxID=309807 RepID=Q2S3E0_SALRD|nr:hypothetical protein SRU_1165 [Salinibacter ruber DSM 13855]
MDVPHHVLDGAELRADDLQVFVGLAEARQPALQYLQPSLLDGPHPLGVVGHVLLQRVDGLENLRLRGAVHKGPIPLPLVKQIEVRVQQAVDLVDVTPQNALRGVAELLVVRLDLLFELPELGVAALALVAELAENFALGRRLVLFGALLGANVPLKPVVPRHHPQVEELRPAPQQQEELRQPGGKNPDQPEARRHGHDRDQKHQIPGVEEGLLRVVDVVVHDGAVVRATKLFGLRSVVGTEVAHAADGFVGPLRVRLVCFRRLFFCPGGRQVVGTGRRPRTRGRFGLLRLHPTDELLGALVPKGLFGLTEPFVLLPLVVEGHLEAGLLLRDRPPQPIHERLGLGQQAPGALRHAPHDALDLLLLLQLIEGRLEAFFGPQVPLLGLLQPLKFVVGHG